MEMALVDMTMKNREKAEKIGSTLVQERLAACVNIIDGMKSIYFWEGKLEETNETVLIAKTRMSLSRDITVEVKKCHSYQCPAILVIPIQGGNPDFLKWVFENTSEEND